MTVFFTSDHHIHHRAMAWMRKYGEWPKDRSLITPELVDWHDDMLADAWDSVVRKDDTVWVLGDLVANSSSVKRGLAWMRDRPGDKHFVTGNHDPAHPMHEGSHIWRATYLAADDFGQVAFKSLQEFDRRKIHLSDGSKQEVLLSHFPYTGDGEGREDRCDLYRMRDEGLPILHGHVHSKQRVTYDTDSLVTSFRGDVKQIHVGVDAWDFKPVSLEQIVTLLEEVPTYGD